MIRRIITAVLSLSLIAGVAVPVVCTDTVSASDVVSYSADSVYNEKVLEMRGHFLNRDKEFSIEFPSEIYSGFDDLRLIISDAVTENGNPIGGDYLKKNCGSMCYTSYTGIDSTTVKMKVNYYTTAEQEAELSEKVADIIASLDFGSGSDYEKTKAIYDYIKNNVEYADSFDDELIFTAYGASVNGVAVCQGYSVLLYRMLMEAGVNCRILPGTAAGGSHLWNMAEIDGIYYLMDVTFDSTVGMEKNLFFLRGTEDFDEFRPDAAHKFDVSSYEDIPLYYEFTRGSDFLSRFDISPTAYDPASPPVLKANMYGDANNDGKVEIADATLILQYLTNKDEYSLSARGMLNADVIGNDGVTANDALVIQQVDAGIYTIDDLPLQQFHLK